jgi:drug/metabolite transporter (DMT)-like permease
MPTLAVAGWQLLIGALPMVAVVPIVEGVHWPQASAAAWLATGYVTFIALIVGFFAWFQMVKIMPVNVASISSLLVPVVGVIGGAVLLGEAFGLRETAALLLIGTALTLVLVLPARPASGSAGSAGR